MNFQPGNKLIILTLIPPVFFFFFLLLSKPFRAFTHAYGIALITKFDFNKIISDEESVISALKDIVRNSGDYSMRAFTRKVMSPKVRKTSETTHSFNVITGPDGTFNTLSFSATGKLPTSKGAWAMDTEGDIASYTDYLNKNNRWENEEIKTDKGINTPLTLNKVLSKAQSGMKYFFHARVNKNDNYDNCNTAVLETLVENVD